MTARHDLDRVLTAWLTDELGPVEAPSYFGETLDLIDRTPQRRAWPWSGLAIPRRWTRIDVPAGARVGLVVALLILALTVAALIGAFRQPPPQVPTGPGRILITSGGDITVVNPDGGFTKLSETPTDETMAAWSPDGTRVAFWTWINEDFPDGTSKTTVPLTLMNADGTNEVTLLDGIDPPITTVVERPTWSPDGRFIVVSIGGKLHVVAVDDASVTALADDGLNLRTSPTWSTDGRWIAFHASLPQTEPGSRPIGSVHVIRPDGSEETVVSGETKVWGGNFGPQWSADSRHLAYVTPVVRVDPEFGEYTLPEGIEIATRDPSGWSRAAVPDAGPLDDQVMLVWAPDSARLAYLRSLPGSTPEGFVSLQLTLVGEDLTARPVTEEPLSQGFCWSPDGTRIAAVTNDQHLVTIDVATGAQLEDFGVTEVNVGDACVWSAWAGEPPAN